MMLKIVVGIALLSAFCAGMLVSRYFFPANSGYAAVAEINKTYNIFRTKGGNVWIETKSGRYWLMEGDLSEHGEPQPRLVLFTDCVEEEPVTGTWRDYEWLAADHERPHELQMPPPRLNLPTWAFAVAAENKLEKGYWPAVDINPFFLTGDFDGDSKTDIAIRILNKHNGQIGLAIMHFADKQLFIIGAGNEFERLDDLRVFDMWTLEPKGTLDSGWEEAPVVLKGDAIMLIKTESAVVALYWNGKTYARYQMSD
jgi:hypothetical protein